MPNKFREKILVEKSKIIFFDFDGVIKESIEAKSEAFMDMIPSITNNLRKKIKAHHELNGGISRFKKIPIYLEWAGLESTEYNISKFSKFIGLSFS